MTKKIILLAILSFVFYIGCSSDSESTPSSNTNDSIASDTNDSTSDDGTSAGAGCVSCHLDKDKLAAVADPDTSAGNTSGET